MSGLGGGRDMIRLILLTLCGLGLVLMIGGRDLSPEELATLQTQESEATTEVARASSMAATDLATPSADAKLSAVPETSTLAANPDPDRPKYTIISQAAPAKPKPVSTDDQAAGAADLRVVTASAVNVRSGPSTSFAVLDRVVNGEITEVIEVAEAGWVKIRIEGDGVEGYMAARFLKPMAQ